MTNCTPANNKTGRVSDPLSRGITWYHVVCSLVADVCMREVECGQFSVGRCKSLVQSNLRFVDVCSRTTDAAAVKMLHGTNLYK